MKIFILLFSLTLFPTQAKLLSKKSFNIDEFIKQKLEASKIQVTQKISKVLKKKTQQATDIDYLMDVFFKMSISGLGKSTKSNLQSLYDSEDKLRFLAALVRVMSESGKNHNLIRKNLMNITQTKKFQELKQNLLNKSKDALWGRKALGSSSTLSLFVLGLSSMEFLTRPELGLVSAQGQKKVDKALDGLSKLISIPYTVLKVILEATKLSKSFPETTKHFKKRSKDLWKNQGRSKNVATLRTSAEEVIPIMVAMVYNPYLLFAVEAIKASSAYYFAGQGKGTYQSTTRDLLGERSKSSFMPKKISLRKIPLGISNVRDSLSY